MALQTQPVHRPIKILLAEDDLADARLTFEVFKQCNIPVEIARVRDGEDALAYLRMEGEHSKATVPDIIFLDLNMPRVNGLEALAAIKSDPRLRDIPVLMLTCSRSDQDKSNAYESKANFYAVKPADLNEFFEFAKFVQEIWLKGLQQGQDQVPVA
jgi:two-component system, chemotaxis family, response regulator Rcp1